MRRDFRAAEKTKRTNFCGPLKRQLKLNKRLAYIIFTPNITYTIMEAFLSAHLDAIISAILGLLTGGIAVHFHEKKNSDNTRINRVNTGGGDFAGRDMHKK